MDETAQAIGPSEPGKVDIADERRRTGRRRRTLAERSVAAVRVVVLDVLGEHDLQMAAAEDEHPVEAFAAQGPNHELTDRIGPRRRAIA
jgi:hypothetical protein